jgi:hypothetical protein
MELVRPMTFLVGQVSRRPVVQDVLVSVVGEGQMAAPAPDMMAAARSARFGPPDETQDEDLG